MHTFIKSLVFISLTAVILPGCSEQKENIKEERFVVTDSLINRLLIDTIGQANSLSSRNFSARISADEEKMANIFPMVSGIVKNVPIKLGDKVNKGQLLATMESAEMAGFDKEAISASAELRNAERNAKLTEDLYKDGLASERELDEARNNLKVAQAEHKRSQAILQLNGGNTNGTYAIKSPIAGFVIEKTVNSNMQVRPDNDQSIFKIADLSKVWALINIYESDISRIEEGNEVDIYVLSYPEKTFKGKIDKIYNILDAESKVMNARVTIDNPGFKLKPGMMATVQIAVKSRINLPVINSNSVIFDNNKNYVLLLDQENKIKIQEVEVAYKAENKSYLSKGIKQGDRIIGSKQVFLYESLK
jgi:cobalt-zinc-cadmium efflux system membrane fusion protein